MKRYSILFLVLVALLPMLNAQEVIKGVKVDNSNMSRSGKYMAVDMDMVLSGMEVESNRAVLLTPMIVNGSDSLKLPPIGVYGRTRYYHYLRNGGGMIAGKDEQSYRSNEKPDTLRYHQVVEYQKWMNGSKLVIDRKDYGCCKHLLAQQDGAVGAEYVLPVVTFAPEFAYVRPKAEEHKTRSLSRRSYIDFPVSKTDIYPDYRNNPRELAIIRATIDSVKNDKDMKILSLSIKGFASPESPYANNARLAQGRTEALKNYVEQMYHFGEGFIKTSYEPEDWDGLREYVEQCSTLKNRDAILAEINGPREPDNKEWVIKSRYKEDYAYLKEHCYPALRHSDYVIDYEITQFTDIEEIKRVFNEQPKKLSLNEFFMLAETYAPGSDEFNKVFEVAHTIFPDNAVANLNMANTSMARNDMAAAKSYLANAGDTPEATYARGVYAAINKNYAEAEKYFTAAKNAGVAQAEQALKQLDEVRKNSELLN